MNKLYSMVIALVLVIACIWFQAEPTLLANETFMQWRSALIQITGIVSVLLLTLTMLLALRLPLIENLTRGLDKAYRLHKWIAIYGVIIGAVHWLLAIVPKQLVSAGYLARPQRGASFVDPDSFYAVIRPLRGSAEAMGEWTLYLFIGLTLVALFAPIRYKVFKWAHKLMAIAFIVIGYHSLILLKHSYWDSLITPITVVVVLAGIVAAILSLTGWIGRKHKHSGSITEVVYDQDNNTTRLSVHLPSWRGHLAGQFAFIKIGGEEPHPFTIASVDSEQRNVSFLIKALGDFTANIHKQVQIGQKVEIEGPYGKFDFDDKKKQLWIAGGIGCAAFKARLEELAQLQNRDEVVFYYCTKTPSPSLIEEMERAANKANVEFHVVDNRLKSFLSIDQIRQKHPDIVLRSIWFCGPVGFKNALLGQLKGINFDTNNFHSELFNFR
ncbi:ferric reductase-like transmembrane domain-containing protein [Vibrio tapetis subsp. quintayensis]|uniref:ferredoxin reductase family protein n=1 Tax=Vibrio tapetis TaxID=52443 RepID=UPI0025B286A4|nr:ferric reductase-like transmembrane domain-containing protein [Vibrio tapetis]MDN3680317.1 ferric reductase-like transmembrane domain-containing protein [Vibrio tapetis subsp. quintayensis]